MAERAEIVASYAVDYLAAGKKTKGRLLDELVTMTGWSRDNARRRMVAAVKQHLGADLPRVQPAPAARRTVYSQDAIEVLRRVWSLSGEMCGRYLQASMRPQLDGLERYGELIPGAGGYGPGVRDQLLAMSGATIDRYLRPERARPWRTAPPRRVAIRVRPLDMPIDSEPGLIDGGVLNHGVTRSGHPLRTLALTCCCTGWVLTRTMHGARALPAALTQALARLPFEVVHLRFGSVDEETDQALAAWAAQRNIGLTLGQQASQPASPTVVPPSGATHPPVGDERSRLNRLWTLLDDRTNYLTPTRKRVGHRVRPDGTRTRRHDAPATPLQRLIGAQVLAPVQSAELLAYRDRLNPAAITRLVAALWSGPTRLPLPQAS